MKVTPLTPPDPPWVRETIDALWGGEPLVSASGSHYLRDLNGLKASDADGDHGFCHFWINEGAMELVTLAVTGRAKGVGRILLDAALDAARKGRCTKAWLVTTSDNTRAIGFYERTGFQRTGIMADWMARVRQEKPHLDIPDHDGLIYELAL